jgi:hypothetical protein
MTVAKLSSSGSSGCVLRELNCRRIFPAAPAAVLQERKSLAGLARRHSGNSALGVQSLSPPWLPLRTATEARRQSGRERDCIPGAERPPSSPRRSCSSAGRSFGKCRRGTFRNAYLTQKIMYRLFSKFVCVWEHQRPKTSQIPGKVLFS